MQKEGLCTSGATEGQEFVSAIVWLIAGCLEISQSNLRHRYVEAHFIKSAALPGLEHTFQER